MKTSARNQFPGTVTRVESGPVTTEVVLGIDGDLQVAATVTTSTATRMGLAVGQAAVALVKASAVVLVTDAAGYRLSARNQLPGKVSRIDKGAVSTLVGITLPAGQVVTATITNDALDDLGLAMGGSCTAIFKAYSVILAVAEPA